ncbi:MAG: aminoglycoside 6-adenylyltransferase [bacterium]|nr:aminoglycoside 6-adenylyltransferase [bacterium]
MREMDTEEFIAEFTKWANGQKEILGVLLVGSYAINSAKSDSDIDLVIITDQPVSYLEDDKWVKGFGEVKEIIREVYKSVQVKRVFYSNGLEVEYGITTPEWAKINPVDSGTERVIKDGVKILLDKNDILKLLIDTLNKL